MKKLSMIGIVGGAALLTAVPLSLQWSQVGPAVPLLTVSHANAQYYGPLPSARSPGLSSSLQTCLRRISFLPRSIPLLDLRLA